MQTFTYLVLFYGTTLTDLLQNFAPLSQPIRCKTKTNRPSPTDVFPRFVPPLHVFAWGLIGSLYCLRTVVASCVNGQSQPVYILWFWFYDTKLKTALNTNCRKQATWPTSPLLYRLICVALSEVEAEIVSWPCWSKQKTKYNSLRLSSRPLACSLRRRRYIQPV